MPNPPNMNDLLKQAQKMQEQLMAARAEAESTEVEGQSGGGVVKIRVTGAMEFVGVTIDPAAVDPADVGMLEDLVLAALHDAVAKAGALSEQAMGGLDLGDLAGGIPGLGGGGGLGGLLGG